MSRNEYDFTLKFSLADRHLDPSTYVEQLGEAGCDDALIGTGEKGKIALQFNREASSALEAVSSAINDVLSVIPNAKLTEATPDLVGLTEIAEVIGCSRQNMRQLVIRHSNSFPEPIYSGSLNLWHLLTVLDWFEERQGKTFTSTLKEIAETNMQLNLIREAKKLNTGFSKKLSNLLPMEQVF